MHEHRTAARASRRATVHFDVAARIDAVQGLLPATFTAANVNASTFTAVVVRIQTPQTRGDLDSAASSTDSSRLAGGDEHAATVPGVAASDNDLNATTVPSRGVASGEEERTGVPCTRSSCVQNDEPADTRGARVRRAQREVSARMRETESSAKVDRTAGHPRRCRVASVDCNDATHPRVADADGNVHETALA